MMRSSHIERSNVSMLGVSRLVLARFPATEQDVGCRVEIRSAVDILNPLTLSLSSLKP